MWFLKLILFIWVVTFIVALIYGNPILLVFIGVAAVILFLKGKIVFVRKNKPNKDSAKQIEYDNWRLDRLIDGIEKQTKGIFKNV